MIEIEVHVAKLVQLFNNIDAAPFASRDSIRAPRGSSSTRRRTCRATHRSALPCMSGARPATRRSWARRSTRTSASSPRRRGGGCASLFRRGRISLAIGLVFLAVALAASKLAEGWLDPGGMLDVAAA